MEGPGGTGAPRGGSGARGRECPSAAGREKGRKGPEAAGSGSGSERTGWRVPESSLGAWRGPRRTQPRVLRGFVGGACVGVSKSSRVPRDAHPRLDQVRLEGGVQWAQCGRRGVGRLWDPSRARAVRSESSLSRERKSRILGHREGISEHLDGGN